VCEERKRKKEEKKGTARKDISDLTEQVCGRKFFVRQLPPGVRFTYRELQTATNTTNRKHIHA
jgi:hypothetical protein